MRIIADRRDYYDCIQAHGQDQSIVYVREPEMVKLHRAPYNLPTRCDDWPFPSSHAIFSPLYCDALRIIGFCSKIYPMIELSDTNRQTWAPAPTVRCFSIEDVDAFAEAATNNKDFENYRGAGKRRGRHYYRRCKRKYFLRFFDECEKAKESHLSMFEDKMCPVFVATEFGTGDYKTEPNIVYNALLSPHEFFRVFDTHAAFQEIAMFLGNMAIPQKPMPVIPDELKIHSRGFNEWSFRRPPAGQ